MLDFHKVHWGSSPVWDSYFKNVVWARGLEHLSVFRLEETLTKKEKEKTDEQVFKWSILGVSNSLDSLEVPGAFILLISLQVVSTDLYRLVPSSIDLKSQKEGTLWRKTKNLTVCENYWYACSKTSLFLLLFLKLLGCSILLKNFLSKRATFTLIHLHKHP